MVNVTYDELERVAKLLMESSDECQREAANTDLPIKDRTRWLSEGLSYAVAAKKLRDTMLTAE